MSTPETGVEGFARNRLKPVSCRRHSASEVSRASEIRARPGVPRFLPASWAILSSPNQTRTWCTPFAVGAEHRGPDRETRVTVHGLRSISRASKPGGACCSPRGSIRRQTAGRDSARRDALKSHCRLVQGKPLFARAYARDRFQQTIPVS